MDLVATKIAEPDLHKEVSVSSSNENTHRPNDV
jgi:hypothetical protein